MNKSINCKLPCLNQYKFNSKACHVFILLFILMPPESTVPIYIIVRISVGIYVSTLCLFLHTVGDGRWEMVT